jgi:hypothetical protein
MLESLAETGGSQAAAAAVPGRVIRPQRHLYLVALAEMAVLDEFAFGHL